MIENELATEKGRLAAQFLMGMRYIEALAKQAKPENMFLVKQDVDFVPSQVHDSINLLDLATDTTFTP